MEEGAGFRDSGGGCVVDGLVHGSCLFSIMR